MLSIPKRSRQLSRQVSSCVQATSTTDLDNLGAVHGTHIIYAGMHYCCTLSIFCCTLSISKSARLHDVVYHTHFICTTYICVYGNALSTIFLLAFGPCFLLFVFRFSFLTFLIFFLHPGMVIFFVSLRLCSSHLLLSASTYSIVRVLSARVIRILPHLGNICFLLV